MRPLLTVVALLASSCPNSALAQTTYLVDAVNGFDTNHGTSQTSAWKAISKVNKSSFKHGGLATLQKRTNVARTAHCIALGGEWQIDRL